MIKKVKGHLILDDRNKHNYKFLENIEGHLSINLTKSIKPFHLKNLLFVKGDIIIQGNSNIIMDNLVCANNIVMCGNSYLKVPKLEKTIDISISYGFNLSADNLVEILDFLTVNTSERVIFPGLKKINVLRLISSDLRVVNLEYLTDLRNNKDCYLICNDKLLFNRIKSYSLDKINIATGNIIKQFNKKYFENENIGQMVG